MTIAQQKIINYCKENNIGMSNLSVQLGYSYSFLLYLANGRIPCAREIKTIEEFFNIKNNSHLLKDNMLDKHKSVATAHKYYNLFSGHKVYWRTFYRWSNGILPRDKRKLQPLLKTYNIKNEWIDEI